MFIHRKNNNKGKSALGVVVFMGVMVVVLLVSMFNRAGRHSEPISTGTTKNPAAAPQPLVENPIDKMLASSAGAAKQDGTAVAVLIDTSGSMADVVGDGKGGQKPKIDIARQALVNVVRQSTDFATKHPDRKMLLGIYEFSARGGQSICRTVVPLGAPNVNAAQSAVQKIRPSGNTPIGSAMLQAKQDLDRTGMSKMHILVITDGQSNQGYALDDVVASLARQEGDARAAMYFVAFDTASDKFKAVRNCGGTLMSAANEPELQQTLDYILAGKILVEAPEISGKK